MPESNARLAFGGSLWIDSMVIFGPPRTRTHYPLLALLPSATIYVAWF